MRFAKPMVAVLGALFIAVLSTPLIALWQIESALVANDAGELSIYLDKERIARGVKSLIQAPSTLENEGASVKSSEKNDWSFERILADSMADSVVERLTSAEVIIDLYESIESENTGLDSRQSQWSFGYDGINDFHVSKYRGGTLLYRADLSRYGLVRWRVVSIQVPSLLDPALNQILEVFGSFGETR